MSTCTCQTARIPANAEPTTAYFPGIRRFAVTEIVVLSPDCGEHGWRHVDNADPRLSLAANLRYGD